MTTPALHTAWLFQAIASFPTAFVLGIFVFDNLLSLYNLNVYRFIAFTFNTLFASAIIFSVLVQWSLAKRGSSNPRLTLALEVSKAAIATIMWIWLLLDSIFYKRPYYYNREKGIAVAAVSVILVLVLFYPTAIYAVYARKADGTNDQEAGGQAESAAATETERTPLLAERG